jgi:hypothetical protein
MGSLIISWGLNGDLLEILGEVKCWQNFATSVLVSEVCTPMCFANMYEV